ncbi:MAG TPA: hypothetical protein VGK24_15060 [Candidatus Angelobacter sp.]
MSDKSDSKNIHKRVSLGDNAPSSGRRSGIANASPGHVAEAAYSGSATQKKSSRRAVRANINQPQSTRKD